jgi:hypothetical protein
MADLRALRGLDLYWGDIHRSSSVSGGMASMAEHFRVARHELGLQVFAICDNAVLTRDPTKRRAFFGELTGPRSVTDGTTPLNLENIHRVHTVEPQEWADLQAMVEAYDEPGAFVPLLAYEWCSARYGDHNVYYKAKTGDLHLPPTLPQLHTELGDAECLVLPHHMGYARGRRGKDWNFHFPRRERLAEVYSLHGSSESPTGTPLPLSNIGMGGNVPGSSLQEAWARGYKLGVLASSDCHGLPQEHVLVGLWATALTREGIWEALWQRRTFGTTGAQRIEVTFSADGLPMGSLYSTDTDPIFEATVKGTQPLRKVEIVKNNEVLYTLAGEGRSEISLSYRDGSPPDRPDNWVYLRVSQTDGNLAWSSPVWISILPEHEAVRGCLYWEPEGDLLFDTVREGSATTLRVLNDNLERHQVHDVSFEVLSDTRETIHGPAVLSPGDHAEARFTVADEALYRVHYTDVDDNRRTVQRTLITGPLTGGR